MGLFSLVVAFSLCVPYIFPPGDLWVSSFLFDDMAYTYLQICVDEVCQVSHKHMDPGSYYLPRKSHPNNQIRLVDNIM